MSTPKNALLGVLLRLPRKAAASLVVATMLFLSGCAIGRAIQNTAVSSPDALFCLAYDSEEVIRDQSKVATITSTYAMQIDGVHVTPENMRCTNKNGALVVDVLPGEHKIALTAPASHVAGTKAQGGGFYGPGILLPTTQQFESGRIYNAFDMTIWTRVEENTSAEVAQKIAENRNNAVFEKKK